MLLYHQTQPEQADAIRAHGFADHRAGYTMIENPHGSGYVIGAEHRGVLLTNFPHDFEIKTALFAVELDLTSGDLAAFDWTPEELADDPTWPREWLVPAAIVNRARFQDAETTHAA